MNDSTVLKARQLYRTYQQGGEPIEVLRGVDLDVGRAERVAILGASGTGKSTLLHLLGGLDQPDRGQISICGQALKGQSQRALARIRNQHLGFVYQFHHLLPEFSALDNVAMPLYLSSCSVSEAQQRARELLERVGLGHRLTHKPGQLSGGERQRAAVARALVTKPACVLADEPTGNLDEENSEQMYQLMLELNQSQGTALVIVTHDLVLARKMDRVLVMTHGVLDEDSETD